MTTMQQTWTGDPLEARSLDIRQCPHCKTLVLVFEAADGTVFAQGHVEEHGLLKLLSSLAELMKEQHH